MKMLDIIIKPFAKEIEIPMHSLENLGINLYSAYQSSTDITIRQCPNHPSFPIQYK